MGKKTGQEISAHTWLDSGAEGIIVDQDFSTKHKLMLRTLVNLLPIKNVDGTLNKRGSVKFTTIQKIWIKTFKDNYHEKLSELYVTTLGDHNIILGIDWLHAHNPEVDWAFPQIVFTRCPKTCTLSKKPLVIMSKKLQTQATTINALNPDDPDTLVPEETFAQDAIEAFLYNHSFTKYNNLAIKPRPLPALA